VFTLSMVLFLIHNLSELPSDVLLLFFDHVPDIVFTIPTISVVFPYFIVLDAIYNVYDIDFGTDKELYYAPHLVSYLIDGSNPETNPTILRPNLIAKCQQIASFPLADTHVVIMKHGSVLAAESVLMSSDFAMSSQSGIAALVPQQIPITRIRKSTLKGFVRTKWDSILSQTRYQISQYLSREHAAVVCFAALTIVLCVITVQFVVTPMTLPQ